MVDIADRAQAREEEDRADALTARAMKMFHEEPFEIEGKRVCADCFEPLLKKRLKAAPEAVRCVDCQKLREKLNGRKR